MNEVTFEIKEHIGTIKASRAGWTREANIVSWNGGAPKVDIREWDERHERMTRGITLTEEEAEKLAEILTARYNRSDTIPPKWYAILMDDDDTDWGTGSYSIDSARARAIDMGARKIAVIEMGKDPICIDEIEVQ